MRVSGFTFVRNGTMLGYPFVESILSALPLCDEFVVAVGLSEDDTLQRVQRVQNQPFQLVQFWAKINRYGFGFIIRTRSH